jgi:hypothetical protein
MKAFESLKTRWVVWVWNHTPNCAEMSRLASQSWDHPLPWSTRFRMRLHYLICVWCKRYFKQLQFLHEAEGHFEEHAGNLPSRGLSTEARQRILKQLQVAADKRT